ncbi:biotin transporter BioY [Clostridium fermenticellae]|uniref:Biotin transporter n=1 Tax=Clostridium fermenticellae TaxID=2068654 RepID=A0A386H4S9_9CLOT|nr:biotin transporter BioY [Clostridium fermenticellae]AYD40505.1 biotin transporter BioY [Clostridium fermenticellae]
MNNRQNIHNMALIGVMAAVICILGPLSIPIGPVPISFTNFAIYIAIYILGMKKGVTSYVIYMLLGLVGLPVFSNFSGGATKLFGLTGGYIIGFIFMAVISGLFIDNFINKWYLCFIGMILGTVVCYIFGSIWLAYQAHISASSAFLLGVIPFIPGDIIKIIIAVILGPKLRMRLTRANIIRC